jgi:hypothetical protein
MQGLPQVKVSLNVLSVIQRNNYIFDLRHPDVLPVKAQTK